MLRHPCILGDPQRQARGAKLEVVPNKRDQHQTWLPHPCLLGGQKERGNATSPLHSRGSPTKGTKTRSGYLPPTFSGPKRGRKCYATPAFSGIPIKGEQNHKWLPHPCLLKGPKEGGNATSPLHSRGSPTPSAGSKIRSGPQQTGPTSDLAASSLPSRRPKRARKCYLTPAFSGIPNKGDQNQKWLPPPYLPRAQKRAEMLCHPCILGDPHQRRAKSQVAASPLPSQGPKGGRKCYVTLAFSGIPNAKQGEQN